MRKSTSFINFLFVFCFFFTCTYASTYVFSEDISSERAIYTTASPQTDHNAEPDEKSDPAMEPAPYTDFKSLRPVFAEEALDGEDLIELLRMDVEKIYEEFKGTVVYPPDPKGFADPSDYKIDDAVVAQEKCAELCRNINKLIFSVTDRSVKFYGPFLQAMRDVVYLDAVCLKEYNEGNISHRELWYSLHNKWMSAVGERYEALEQSSVLPIRKYPGE